MIFKSLFILCCFLFLPSTNLMANADILKTIDKYYKEFKNDLDEYFNETNSQPKLGDNIFQALSILLNMHNAIPHMQDNVKTFLKDKNMDTFNAIKKLLEANLNLAKIAIFTLQKEMKINGGNEEKLVDLSEAVERSKAPQKEESGNDLGFGQKIERSTNEAAIAEKWQLYFTDKLFIICAVAIYYLNIICKELQIDIPAKNFLVNPSPTGGHEHNKQSQGEQQHSDAGSSSIHQNNDKPNPEKGAMKTLSALFKKNSSH